MTGCKNKYLTLLIIKVALMVWINSWHLLRLKNDRPFIRVLANQGEKVKGTILNIFISKNAINELKSINEALLISGKGIEGDRYHSGKGTFSEKLKGNPAAEITLIEKEEVDNFNNEQNLNLSYEDFRRNLVTEGIRLNNLVGKTFTIGSATLKGIRLCEPCSHLAESVNSLVIPHLIGRGGLRAQILSTSNIKVGEEISINK